MGVTQNTPEQLRALAAAADKHGQHTYTHWRDSNAAKANELWCQAASPELVTGLLDRIKELEAWQDDVRSNSPLLARLDRAEKRVKELEATHLTDGEIFAAQERLIAAKDELYRSRIGQGCYRCKKGTYRADGNGYHDFHRCDSCRHVPMWGADGNEFGVKTEQHKEPWLCLLCKSSRPGNHGFLDDRTTPCPNKGKT
ncbi:hypothetical protein [Comamonas sp. lk]|uniref:hypothetical protein n=1 Tax=Comamonas sp. lk TaxID=2201272 RepID=UPI0013CE5376|nr:hypothetical protein [Comamonas sp. lk]